MFSEALRKQDENTINFMIDDMKGEIDGLKKELADRDRKPANRDKELADKDRKLLEQEQEILELKKLLAEKKSNGKVCDIICKKRCNQIGNIGNSFVCFPFRNCLSGYV